MSNSFNIEIKGFIRAHLDSVSGYTNEDALIELIHNGDDAGANKIMIIFEKREDGYYLFIIDNGCGMDFVDITNMNVLYRHQEHNNDDGHGTFGFGAKGAMLCIGGLWTFLSKKKGEKSICKLVWDVELMKEDVTINKHIPDLNPKCTRISDESGVDNTNLYNNYISKVYSNNGTIAMCKLPFYDVLYDEIDDFEDQLIRTMKTMKFKNNNKKCQILFLNSVKDKNAKIQKLLPFDILDYKNTIDSKKIKLTILGRYINVPKPYPEFYIGDENNNFYKFVPRRNKKKAYFRKTDISKIIKSFDRAELAITLLNEKQIEHQKELLNKESGIYHKLAGIFIDRNGNYISTDSSCWGKILAHQTKSDHLFSAAQASSGKFTKGARCVLSYHKTKSSKVFDQVIGCKANKSKFEIDSVHDKLKNMLKLLIDSVYKKIIRNCRKQKVDIKADAYLENNLNLCNIPQIVSNILNKEDNQKRKVEEAEKEAARKALQQAKKEKEEARKAAEAEKEAARKALQQAKKEKEEGARKAAEERKALQQAERENENLQQKINKQMADEKAKEEKIAAQVVNQTDENFKEKINNNLGIVWKDVTKNPDFTDEKRKKMAEINILLEEYINNFLND